MIYYSSTASSTYSETETHEQTRFRSPYALSILPTAGQNFFSFVYGKGYAALFLEYEWFHSSEVNIFRVWGAFLSILSFLSCFPSSISFISSLIEIRASQNLSISSSIHSPLVQPSMYPEPGMKQLVHEIRNQLIS